MKRLIFIVTGFLLSCVANAQVTVKVQSPSQCEVGQRIRISYVVNTQDVDDIQVGDFTGFDVLFGPSTSTQSSFSMVNGKTSQSSSITFTYTLLAKTAGTHKTPVANIKSGGKNYKSNQTSIEVLPPSNGGGSAGSSSESSTMRTQSAGEKISANDLFFTVTTSKTQVYEQEAILLTYKLYTLVSIDQCSGKVPELDGFHTEEIDLPQNKSLKMERHNGKNYGSVVWLQYVLFPQKTGKLSIPAVNFDCEVVQQDRSLDPFEAFFGGGSQLIRIKKRVVAPAVDITVLPLPARPQNFSGAVGSRFSVSAILSPQQVDANDAVQLRLTVNGVGNMNLMKSPTVAWPKDFESYDPKMTDNTKVSANGISGNVVYNYTAVPRHGGKYSIPPIEFCYFDTDSKSYKTLTTDSFSVAVAKGTGYTPKSNNNKEDVMVLNSDIRFIKLGDAKLEQSDHSFAFSWRYWTIYVTLFIIMLLASVLVNRQLNSRGQVAYHRGRQAGKAASKRLKNASKLLKAGDDARFYDEITRALWGYVSDKLNLPVSELNKDNIGEQLAIKGVGEEQIQRFLDVLAESEYARFAPGDANDNMENMYLHASDIIEQLDLSIQ